MLAKLADPEASPIDISESEQGALLDLARPHGVGNILWRKFGSDPDTHAGEETLRRVGQTMLLDSLRHEITANFKAKGIQACIVKGPVLLNDYMTYRVTVFLQTSMC